MIDVMSVRLYLQTEQIFLQGMIHLIPKLVIREGQQGYFINHIEVTRRISVVIQCQIMCKMSKPNLRLQQVFYVFSL